jgi:hypothetical protein
MKTNKLRLTSLTLAPHPIKFLENAIGENTPSLFEDADDKSLPRFTLLAYTGSVVQTRELPLPMVIDLSGLDIPTQKIPVRYEHKSFQGVGHTEKIEIIGTDLIAEGVISRDTSWSRDIMISARNGFPWQASMGGPIFEFEYISADQEVHVNGKTFKGELYVIRKMTLKEISFVDLGADSNTAAVVKLQFDDTDNSELDQNNAIKIDSNTPINIENMNIDTEKMMRDIQIKMLIDQRRIAAIEKIGGGKFPELEAQAIESGWAVEKFHAELQHRTIPDTSKLQQINDTKNQMKLNATTLEAIALASSGSSSYYLESCYDASTLEYVDKFRGIGIQEFCELACGGKYLPKYRRDSCGWLEAAFSSATLPGILSNVANKVLLEGFMQMDDTWKKVVKIASVNNFQMHVRYRMNGAFKFERVGQDGELKHGEVTEQQFSQQVGTYGLMFALTRQMIIDDDLGAFTEIPRAIGIGASDAISDAVWTCILANSAQKDGKQFFSSEHKNLVTGMNLDIEGLTKAELEFSKQERSPGRSLGIPAKILLVPAALKVPAETLMKSLNVTVTTEKNKPEPVLNPHAGKYEVVSTPYLSSPAFKGNSSSAWYLLADPVRLTAIEVAFLGGKDRPTVERADADFNILGIQFRGFIDFGVKEQDWRGVIKMMP